MKKLQLAFVLSMTLLLTACHHDLTYRYLLQHPDVGNKIYDECQAGDAVKKQSRQCVMMSNIVTNYPLVIGNITSNHPEELGQQMLNWEYEYKMQLAAYEAKKAELANLKQQNAPAADIQQATTQLTDLGKQCHTLKDQLDFALTVIGLSSSPD